MSFDNIDEYRSAMVKAYAKDEYYKGYEAGKKDAIKYGHWEESACLDDCFWVCSCCKFPSQASAAPKLYKYCPNCGARMGVEDDEKPKL